MSIFNLYSNQCRFAFEDKANTVPYTYTAVNFINSTIVLQIQLAGKMKERSIRNQKLDKDTLLKVLSESQIQISDYAKMIFDSPDYNFMDSTDIINIAEMKVSELGLPGGGDFDDIKNAMKKNKLDYCPIEYAPYIRLPYNSQPSSEILSKNQHPPDSILIFSKPLVMSDEFPKGFYIRNINNTL